MSVVARTCIGISIYYFILASEEEAAAGFAHRGDDPRDQGPGQGAPVPEAVGRGQRQLEVREVSPDLAPSRKTNMLHVRTSHPQNIKLNFTECVREDPSS